MDVPSLWQEWLVVRFQAGVSVSSLTVALRHHFVLSFRTHCSICSISSGLPGFANNAGQLSSGAVATDKVTTSQSHPETRRKDRSLSLVDVVRSRS
jgi:hypothetical protein